MQTTTHETDQKDLIGVGPNVQLRADKVGNQLVEVLAKQTEAMTLSLRLYEMYLTECQRRGLQPKGATWPTKPGC